VLIITPPTGAKEDLAARLKLTLHRGLKDSPNEYEKGTMICNEVLQEYFLDFSLSQTATGTGSGTAILSPCGDGTEPVQDLATCDCDQEVPVTKTKTALPGSSGLDYSPDCHNEGGTYYFCIEEGVCTTKKKCKEASSDCLYKVGANWETCTTVFTGGACKP